MTSPSPETADLQFVRREIQDKLSVARHSDSARILKQCEDYLVELLTRSQPGETADLPSCYEKHGERCHYIGADGICAECGHEAKGHASRVVKSLTTMLGWGNMPPQDTLEATIRSLKACAIPDPVEGTADLLTALKQLVEKWRKNASEIGKLADGKPFGDRLRMELWKDAQSLRNRASELDAAILRIAASPQEPEPVEIERRGGLPNTPNKAGRLGLGPSRCVPPIGPNAYLVRSNRTMEPPRTVDAVDLDAGARSDGPRAADRSSPSSSLEALRGLRDDILVIAVVAGQCSVEGPDDHASRLAAAEADRCSRWAKRLDALLLSGVSQHALNCQINITRHADDSAAYLSEKCTCKASGVSQQETNWRDIETAPKDGTPIVLAEWSDYHERWQFSVSYWRKFLIAGEGFGWVGHAPTHWMPLPSPPASLDRPAQERCAKCHHGIEAHNMDGLGECCNGPTRTGGICQCDGYRPAQGDMT